MSWVSNYPSLDCTSCLYSDSSYLLEISKQTVSSITLEIKSRDNVQGNPSQKVLCTCNVISCTSGASKHESCLIPAVLLHWRLWVILLYLPYETLQLCTLDAYSSYGATFKSDIKPEKTRVIWHSKRNSFKAPA